MSTPAPADNRELLFMGELLESGFRGRIYDGARKPTEEDARLVSAWQAQRERQPRMHGPVSATAGHWMPHGESLRRCECGRCLYGPCPAWEVER